MSKLNRNLLVVVSFSLFVLLIFAGCLLGDDIETLREKAEDAIYTITFNNNGGSGPIPASQTVKAGSSITLPGGSALTRTGHAFGGWNANSAGTGNNYAAGAAYTVNGNATLYAKWIGNAAPQYTVIFNANGATSGSAPVSQTVSSGSSITLPNGNTLSKTGYTFSGWNTNYSGTGTNYAAGDSYTVNNAVTLYARWINAAAPQYTVTFNANGGSGTVPSAQTTNSGSGITLPNSSGISKDGYTFGGWNASENGTGTNYAAGDSFTVNNDVTLYAKWIINAAPQYTITFDANGGEGTVPEAQTVISGSSITLPDGSGLSKVDCTFGSWNTSEDGTGTNYSASDSFTITGDVTLYARWVNDTVPQYTITFDANGGSGTVPSPQTVNTGTSITLSNGSGLSKSGYTLNGWNTSEDGTGTSYAADDSFTATDDITLYAKWEIVTLVPGANLAAKLAWLQTSAVSGVSYTIEVDSDESIAPAELSYGDKDNITITLIGIDSERTIELSSNGSMFTVGSGVTLVLEENITLQGRNDNDAALVTVGSGGTLEMNEGSTITGNNHYDRGGGVYISHGTFIMNGGTISGNTAEVDGGGIYMYYGTFTMNNGVISNNTATYYDGGGVFMLWDAIFTMNGGTISGNTANGHGGGIYVSSGGKFTKTGGTITGYFSDTTNGNVVKNGSGIAQDNCGHAVYAVKDGITKRKEKTAGPTVNLTFDGTGDSPVWSGKWDGGEVQVPGGTLAEKLSWLASNAHSNNKYTIEVDSDESISPTTLSYSGKDKITIILKGIGEERTIELLSNGSMFTVESGVTLVLEENITLKGKNDNTDALVAVNSGGKLEMNEGATITGNTNNNNNEDYRGGGVRIHYGAFIMNGGTITGNTGIVHGGGINMFGGTLTMNNGVISHNTTNFDGGGVYMLGAIFTMSGGTISGNTANRNGGGVWNYGGKFTKTGGTISGYASDTVNGNVVKDGTGVVQDNCGHAVYAFKDGITRRKEKTAGPTVNLSFDGTGDSPVWSGKWDGGEVPGDTLAEKLSWLESNAQSNNKYTIEVDSGESINPTTLSYSGKDKITIILKGIGEERTIELLSNGSLFTVGSGVTLVLENNITLKGKNPNTGSLVSVSNGGTLEMNEGATITGNKTSGNMGGGVYVAVNGTFTMNGGTISSNTANTATDAKGGGIYADGTFTMNSGTISGNTAIHGGAVLVSGSCALKGGTISGNNAVHGGGFFVWYGSFAMSGGTITGNTASALGGGVHIAGDKFTKTGGTITGYLSDTVNGNVVKNGSNAVQDNCGHAVYVSYVYGDSNEVKKRREYTAGTGINLSFDMTDLNSPTWAGEWDDELVAVVPGANLTAKLAWLAANARSHGDYTIEVNANESINPTSLSYSGSNCSVPT